MAAGDGSGCSELGTGLGAEEDGGFFVVEGGRVPRDVLLLLVDLHKRDSIPVAVEVAEGPAHPLLQKDGDDVFFCQGGDVERVEGVVDGHSPRPDHPAAGWISAAGGVYAYAESGGVEGIGPGVSVQGGQVVDVGGVCGPTGAPAAEGITATVLVARDGVFVVVVAPSVGEGLETVPLAQGDVDLGLEAGPDGASGSEDAVALLAMVDAFRVEVALHEGRFGLGPVRVFVYVPHVPPLGLLDLLFLTSVRGCTDRVDYDVVGSGPRRLERGQSVGGGHSSIPGWTSKPMTRDWSRELTVTSVARIGTPILSRSRSTSAGSSSKRSASSSTRRIRWRVVIASRSSW